MNLLRDFADTFKQHVEYTVKSNKDILNLCQVMADKITILEARVRNLEDLHRLEEHEEDNPK